jgi:hypothetical protein
MCLGQAVASDRYRSEAEDGVKKYLLDDGQTGNIPQRKSQAGRRVWIVDETRRLHSLRIATERFTRLPTLAVQRSITTGTENSLQTPLQIISY